MLSFAGLSSSFSNGHKTLHRPYGQPLLLISFDGFRWDYRERADTPYLDYLVKTGAHAPYVRSVFPTTTYPNHYTMVTGLYPENHGIVSNYMYDPVYKARFNVKTTDPRWWNGAEPLWVTNQRQGGRSGVLYWPGYNVKIRGIYPSLSTATPSANIDYANKTGKVYSFQKRIDVVIKWLIDKRPPNFVALYFEEPDMTCHKFGSKPRKIRQAIRRLDRTIGYLITKLHSHNRINRLNIIVTADHGMTKISHKRQIYLDKYLDPDSYDIADSAVMTISPRKGKLGFVYKNLTRVPHLMVYLKEEAPTFLHYSHNRRIAPVLAIAEDGWMVNSTKLHSRFSGEWEGLTHGFCNRDKAMNAFFVAWGPAFRAGSKAKPFENVNLYAMMCKILGIKPQQNNGSLKATASILESNH